MSEGHVKMSGRHLGDFFSGKMSGRHVKMSEGHVKVSGRHLGAFFPVRCLRGMLRCLGDISARFLM